MKGKSFYWVIFSFIFSIVGFFAQVIAIGTGKNMVSVYILAFIYITPLLIDAIEDVVKVEAHNYQQYKLDRVALAIGLGYSLLILMLFVLYANSNTFALSGWWERLVKFVLIVSPSVFVARSFYAFLIKWNQNMNVAKAYYHDNGIDYKG